MNIHVDRARMLMTQSKFDLAEQELRQALSQDSGDSEAHALLAFCLVERKDFDGAQFEAEQAVVEQPDEGLGFRALAHVMYRRNRLKESLEAIEQAIRLEPWHPSNFGQLSAIAFQQSRWQDALNAAEQGLQCDPEDVECTNLRAMALVKLGRREEAGATIAAALANEPDNAVTHANQGWTLLHGRQPKQAAEHFREALRLDPNLEWARVGIIEAMKARHFIYRWMLAFFLWMNRLPPRFQVALIVGILVGNTILNSICNAVPALEPVRLPLALAYILFVWMSWCASTLFNLVLCCSRFGRLVLNPREKAAAAIAAVCIVAGIGIGLSSYLGELYFPALHWMSGMLTLGLVIPISHTFAADESRRKLFLTYTVGLSVVVCWTTFKLYQIPGALELVARQFPDPIPDEQAEALQNAIAFAVSDYMQWSDYSIWGLVLFTWLGLGSGLVERRR
ncbi:MAG: tetratricopeptide repeat protein [Planctomycetota bacterium]|nr:tetratricopeptide repeat protein [Planctomycetota bacterium]